MEKVIFYDWHAPGDLVVLTGAIRDLHRCYPGRYATDVRSHYPDLFIGNPYITPLQDTDPEVRKIECDCPLVSQSNELPYHYLVAMVEWVNEVLGLHIKPTAFKGDIYLSEEEANAPLSFPGFDTSNAPYWVIVAGGKNDFTIKWWASDRYQAVVDHFKGRVQFVQVGLRTDNHCDLANVIDLRGQTSLRQLIRLIYHSQGVVCPVTCAMHLAAAIPSNGSNSVAGFRVENTPSKQSRPCVVIAGGREPPHWEAYPGHQFIHTIGMIDCCEAGGCWRSRTKFLGDKTIHDEEWKLCVRVVNDLPACMHMIKAVDVIHQVERYLIERPRKVAETNSQATSSSITSDKEPGTQLTPEAYIASQRPDPSRIPSVLLMPLTAANGTKIPLIRHQAEQYIRTISAPPSFSLRRGIVICAGGEVYFTNAWVCAQILRHHGCKLPIQFWYRGADELDEKMREMVHPLGVECVDASKIPAFSQIRKFGGWELKPFAIIHSPFEEVILLDADNVPTVDPSFLFEQPEYLQTGAIFWPDFRRLGPQRAVWDLCGVGYRDEPEFESGQIVVNKRQCWHPLQLAMWYNERSDFFYDYVHGDKETFHMAFRKLSKEFAMPKKQVAGRRGVMYQHDFAGRVIFQHRNLVKWRLHDSNPVLEGFRFHDECIHYIAILRSLWGKATANVATSGPPVSAEVPQLRSKTCTPCRDQTAKLTADKIALFRPYICKDWVINETQQRLMRSIELSDFKGALDYAVRIGELAETEGHHPDVTVKWGKLDIVLFTHSIDGLSENDFILASKIDEII